MAGGLGYGPLGNFALGASLVPGFDYSGEATRIKEIVLSYNTDTAAPYLSQDLTTKVKDVVVDDPERIAIYKNRTPILFIRARLAEEDFSSIGNLGPTGQNSKKEKMVTWELFGLYMKDGFRQSNDSHLNSIQDFARNLEAVFQKDPRLTGTSTSATCLWVNPKRTDFGDVIVDGNYIKGFRMDLEGVYRFR